MQFQMIGTCLFACRLVIRDANYVQEMVQRVQLTNNLLSKTKHGRLYLTHGRAASSGKSKRPQGSGWQWIPIIVFNHLKSALTKEIILANY